MAMRNLFMDIGLLGPVADDSAPEEEVERQFFESVKVHHPPSSYGYTKIEEAYVMVKREAELEARSG